MPRQKQEVVQPGNIVALHPRYSGYFDDRDKSGLFLHQFNLEGKSNLGEVPENEDISGIQHAVRIKRLVILKDETEKPPSAWGRNIKPSARTRAMMAEMQKMNSLPRAQDLINMPERRLYRDVIPDITDQTLLEQMLQLESNGDNPVEKPRRKIMELLLRRIKEYVKVVAIVDQETNRELYRKEIKKEGQKDMEFNALVKPEDLKEESGKKAAKTKTRS